MATGGVTLHRLFVYGTLKAGQPNSHVMSEGIGSAVRLCAAVTVDEYPLVIGSQFNVPFLLDRRGSGHRVHGEVYDICDAKLDAIDQFEGFPSLYCRREIPVETTAGSLINCCTYLLPKWPAPFDSLPVLSTYKSNGSHGRPYNCNDAIETFEDLCNSTKASTRADQIPLSNSFSTNPVN